MKRLFKWLLIFILVVILLGALGLFALVHWVNPNDYKPQIEKALRQTSAHNVHIQGDIHWTFFPHLGLVIGKTVFDNPSDYPQDRAFLSFTSAEGSIAVMPLLTGDLNIEKLSLRGFTLHLIAKSAQQNNWTLPKMAKKHSVTKSPPKAAFGNQQVSNLNIRRIEIQDAQIDYQNLATKQQFLLDKVNFNAQDVSFGQAFPITLQFMLQQQPDLRLNVYLQSQVQFSSDKIALPNFTLTITPQRSQTNLASPLTTRATGHLQVQQQQAHSEIQANINLDQFDLSDYTALNGAELPMQNIALTANLMLNAAADPDPLKALQGTITASVQKTILKGVDLGAMLKAFGDAVTDWLKQGSNAANWTRLQQTLPTFTHGSINPSSGQETPFGAFTLQSTLANGLLHIEKADLTGPQLLVQTQGNIDIADSHHPLDFTVQAIGMHTKTQASQVENRVGIAYRITGTAQHIQAKPDWPLMRDQLHAFLQVQVQQHLQQAARQGLRDLFHH